MRPKRLTIDQQQVLVDALRRIVTLSSSVHRFTGKRRNAVHTVAKAALMDTRNYGYRQEWSNED